jgi:hypothetical protein
MKENGIDFNDVKVGVRIRNFEEREDISLFRDWEFEMIRKYLSEEQVSMCNELRK